MDVNIVPAKEIDFLLIQWILPETMISFLKEVIPKMLLIYSKSLVQEVNTQHVDVVHEFLRHVISPIPDNNFIIDFLMAMDNGRDV